MNANDGLYALNVASVQRENAGDRTWFEQRLARSFAMRRADGSALDRAAFLDALRPDGLRVLASFDRCQLPGRERALVTCVVGVGEARFHNVRLFIHSAEAPEGWLWLAWANERID